MGSERLRILVFLKKQLINLMKKFILFIAVFAVFNISYSQTSKWGLSYTAEFTKSEISGGGETLSVDFTVNNINLHYSVLSWANPFQIGPLVSMRFGSIEGESFSDFQLGLNLGYNFSDSFAVVMDTYKVFDEIDDHSIFVFKPAAEYKFSSSIAAQLGYHKYAYGGDMRKNNGIEDMKAGGLLLGLKYKF